MAAESGDGKRFGLLPESAPSGAGRKARPAEICLVTTEIIGPFRNGGIATANTGLAQYLASLGHRVTVLYANLQYRSSHIVCLDQTFEHWQEYYRQYDIELLALSLPPEVEPDAFHQARAYAVEQFLSQRSFDLVFTDDLGGLCFYALQAKRSGVAHRQTPFVVTIHSPHLWVADANKAPYWNFQYTLLIDMELFCIEQADVVLGPSAYLLNYLADHAVQLPTATYIQQYILPKEAYYELQNEDRSSTGQRRPRRQEIDEIVFFGRLETRKGLELFCDMVDILAQTHPKLKVTFLGKLQHINGEPSGSYILRRAEHWPNSIRIITTYGTDRAVEYLSQPGRLAMMTPLIDNSPCVVMEAIANGIPFVTTGGGGIVELIAEDDRERCVAGLSAEALARLVRRAIDEGPAPVQFAIPQPVVRGRMRAFVDQLLAVDPPAFPAQGAATSRRSDRSEKPTVPTATAPPRPLISVCIGPTNRPEILAQQLAAIAAQDDDRMEVIVLGDKGTNQEVFDAVARRYADRGWIFARDGSPTLGGARNAAARSATGDYLLFLDSNSLVLPQLVGTLATAVEESGVDIVSGIAYEGYHVTMPKAETSTIRRFPVGGASLAGGMLSNVFGDTTSLVRRAAFEALGGFTEDPGVRAPDWHLFARATLRGMTHYVVPRPLSLLSIRPDDLGRLSSPTENYRPILKVYEESPVAAVKSAVELVAWFVNQTDRSAELWRFLEALPHGDLHVKLLGLSEDSPEIHGIMCQLLVRQGRVEDSLRYALDNGVDARDLVTELATFLEDYYQRRGADDVSFAPEALRALATQDASPSLYDETEEGDIVVYVVGGAIVDQHLAVRPFPLVNRKKGESKGAHLARVTQLVGEAIGAGGTHLLVPREQADWLGDHPRVAAYFAQYHELVEASDETGLVFTLYPSM